MVYLYIVSSKQRLLLFILRNSIYDGFDIERFSKSDDKEYFEIS